MGQNLSTRSRSLAQGKDAPPLKKSASAPIPVATPSVSPPLAEDTGRARTINLLPRSTKKKGRTSKDLSRSSRESSRSPQGHIPEDEREGSSSLRHGSRASSPESGKGNGNAGSVGSLPVSRVHASPSPELVAFQPDSPATHKKKRSMFSGFFGDGKGDGKYLEAFNAFDKDKSGKLSLHEILNADEVAGVKMSSAHSLLVLFHYDKSGEGSISYSEFRKMVDKIVEIQEKVKAKEEKAERKCKTPQPKRVATPTSGLSSPSSGRKCVRRRFSVEDLTGHDDLSLERAILNFSTEEPEEPSAGTGNIDDLVADAILEDGKRFLQGFLSKKEGRDRFYAWLFKLADADGSGTVSVNELKHILLALTADGINIGDFAYQEGDSDTVVERIMEEFDIGNDGHLTKEEFMRLADLILRTYESSNKKRSTIGNYNIGRLLGRGAVGEVRLGTLKASGKKSAIKIVPLSDLSDREKVDREIKAMIMMKHPNVVRLHEVLESDDCVFLVMELCSGGTLRDIVSPKQPMSEPLGRYYFSFLLDAMDFAHTKGVCHRDLRLDNLLLDKDGQLKVADFGHAALFRQGWDLFSTTLVGSVQTISPEQLDGQAYSAQKIDVWALGVTLYTLLAGRPPFDGDDPTSLFEHIKRLEFSFPDHFTSDVRDIIGRMLKKDPQARPSVAEIKAHKWLKGARSTPLPLTKEVIELNELSANEVTNVWSATVQAVGALNTHYHPGGTTSTRLRYIKCVHTSKMLKFGIALEQEGKKHCLELNLVDGDITEFRWFTSRFRELWEGFMAPPSARSSSQKKM